MKISSDKILSVSAIFLSLGTFIVLIYQSQLMREHEEKSALPKLELWNDPSSGQYTLNLMNRGIGAAIIEKVVIKYNGKTYDLDPRDFAGSYSDSLTNDQLSFQGSNLYEGVIIPTKNKIPLIRTKNLPDNQENPIITLFFGRKAQVIIYYSSIYGTVWRLDGIGDIPDIDPNFESKVVKQLFGE